VIAAQVDIVVQQHQDVSGPGAHPMLTAVVNRWL
jgi:hypothetical protein